MDKITKSYFSPTIGWKKVLKDVTLQIPDNISVGILGRNGAGKSTLINILSHSINPDSGYLSFGQRRISFPLSSGGSVHGSMTGKENIRFLCKLYDYPFQKALEFVEDFAALGDYMYVPVKNYSSGMKGRLSFGISMILDFDTYLIDEGFSAGDANFRKKSQEIFDEKRKNANLIIVSHNPPLIKQLCDWGAILKDGRLTLIKDIDEAIENYKNL